MDKKSLSLGLVFLIGGFLLLMLNTSQESKRQQERLVQQAQDEQQALEETGWAQPVESPSEPAAFQAASGVPQPVEGRLEPAAPAAEKPQEQVATIDNDHLQITLTSYGGAVSNITLLKEYADNPRTTDTPNPVVLNRVSDSPALDLKRSTGSQLAPVTHFYKLVSKSDRTAVFEATLKSGIVIRRSFELTNGDNPEGPEPYTLQHKTTLHNPTAIPMNLDNVYLDMGTAAPTKADYMGFNLNASYYTDGKYRNIRASKFSGGGFLFKKEPKEKIEKDGYIQWGAVKNQFFATIFTSDSPANGIYSKGIRFPQDPKTGKVPMGITASLRYQVPTLQPGDQYVISGSYYAGPKSLDRLSQMDANQDEVMQLGWFLGFFLGLVSFIAKSLLTVMSTIEGLVGNWGIAIIFTTFFIRLLLWPLTAKAARSSKRMQELQKPLQQIREKYADNQQKLNEEMMKLWKKHKINPLSGCWPVLVQFPIFISFFNLLRNSSELRFANFLWINDLSMPDATIPLGDNGLPFLGTAINILPFIWLVSMFFQMKMMPQPSIDNAQTKMIKWMPFIFFPFTYYFSSGLVLYWTTTNCFSIFQQWITNRSRDAEDVAIEEEIAEMENKKAGKLPTGPLISKKKKKKKGGQ